MYGSVGLMWQVLVPSATDRSDRERRAFPRWQAAFPVLYGDGDQFRLGAAVDLSEDGLCFAGECDLMKDGIVSLQMQVGSSPSDWIRVRALVRRVEPLRTAVQFLDLGRADRLRMIEWYHAQVKAAMADKN